MGKRKQGKNLKNLCRCFEGLQEGVYLSWVKLSNIYIRIEAQEMSSVINYIKYVSELLINFIRISNTCVVFIFPVKNKEKKIGDRNVESN